MFLGREEAERATKSREGYIKCHQWAIENNKDFFRKYTGGQTRGVMLQRHVSATKNMCSAH